MPKQDKTQTLPSMPSNPTASEPCPDSHDDVPSTNPPPPASPLPLSSTPKAPPPAPPLLPYWSPPPAPRRPIAHPSSLSFPRYNHSTRQWESPFPLLDSNLDVAATDPPLTPSSLPLSSTPQAPPPALLAVHRSPPSTANSPRRPTHRPGHSTSQSRSPFPLLDSNLDIDPVALAFTDVCHESYAYSPTVGIGRTSTSSAGGSSGSRPGIMIPQLATDSASAGVEWDWDWDRDHTLAPTLVSTSIETDAETDADADNDPNKQSTMDADAKSNIDTDTDTDANNPKPATPSSSPPPPPPSPPSPFFPSCPTS